MFGVGFAVADAMLAITDTPGCHACILQVDETSLQLLRMYYSYLH